MSLFEKPTRILSEELDLLAYSNKKIKVNLGKQAIKDNHNLNQ